MVRGFGIVNKSEIDVFLELACFFSDPADVGNLISGSSAFSKTLYRIQGSRPSPRKRNAKKVKWLSKEALQIAMKRREASNKEEKQKAEEKRKDIPI